MRAPIRTAVTTLAAIKAGALSWSLAEYGLHRFLMHEMRGKGLASKEHLRHHADVTYFSPASKKAASAAGATVVVLPVAWLLAGRRIALAYTGGMISMYYAYEVLHRRIHTHPPRNAYGRHIRRAHLEHHFGSPMRNFGVTSSVWDRAFGTYEDPAWITVPRRMAPVWLMDEREEVRPELSADYQVRGRLRHDPEQDRADWDDAFTNRAPSLA